MANASDIFLRPSSANPADITLYRAGFIAGTAAAVIIAGLVGANFNIIRQAWEAPPQVAQFVPTAENLPPSPIVAANPAFTPYPLGIIGQWAVDWPAQGFQKNALPVTPGDQPPGVKPSFLQQAQTWPGDYPSQGPWNKVLSATQGDQPPHISARPLDALAWAVPDQAAQGFAKTAAWNVPVSTAQPFSQAWINQVISAWQIDASAAQGFQTKSIPANQGDRPPGRAPSFLSWQAETVGAQGFQSYTAAWNVPAVPVPPTPDVTPYSNSSGGGAASPGSRSVTSR